MIYRFVNKIFVLNLIVITLFITACSSQQAQKTLDSYIALLMQGDFANAYQYLSPKDQDRVSQNVFVKMMETGKWFKKAFRVEEVSYQILSIEITEDGAVAVVAFTRPELKSELNQAIDNAADKVSGVFDDIVGKEKMPEPSSVEGRKFVTEEVIYKLVKDEQGDWRINL